MLHHSWTFPCISYNPKRFGWYDFTGIVCPCGIECVLNKASFLVNSSDSPQLTWKGLLPLP
jgi:hypothetical protein